MKIKNYKEFIKESIFSFTGVNYAPHTVAQSLPYTHHDANIPRHKETNATGDLMDLLLHSDITGEYYDKFQIDDILNKYKIWCKQNNTTCDISTISNTKELDYILRKIQ